MSKIVGLTINYSEYKLKSGKDEKIAVFLYSGNSDPKPILDKAVSQYVGDKTHYELIDASLDNPWMRVVVSNINDMKQEEFDSQKL